MRLHVLIEEVRPVAVHVEVGAAAVADRLAIRELFDAYAHCADRRDAEGQKALFTADCRFAVFMSGESTEPTYTIEGREGPSFFAVRGSRWRRPGPKGALGTW
jgi:SnoaL-like domain